MKREEKGVFSRRDFLKVASAGAAGAALLGGLSGCSQGGATPGAGASGSGLGGSSNQPQIEVINAELLVIGTGINGTYAAAQAIAEGRHVTIIDKGVFRHSGVTGMSWDAFNAVFNNFPVSTRAGLIANGDLLKKAWDFDPNPHKYVYMINHGQTFPDRNEDGTLGTYASPVTSQALFFRREMDDYFVKDNATIYDRTMITNFIVEDGVCLGAMGVHLPTGNLRVFRAPATILATGGCTWIYGWITVSACSIGSADNTGDADMAAYRLGAGIGDSEYAQYDVMSSYPKGLACGFGSGVCADAQEAHAIFDKNGDLVFEPGDEMVADRAYFNQRMGEVLVKEGRATENGGVVLKVGDSHIRYSNERNIDLLKTFGVDVRTESIEAIPEMYEHGGQPIIDENMMTEFAGLFHARGSGSVGETGGGQVYYNQIFGPYAAHCASEYIKDADIPESFDPSSVIAEYDRLEEIRTRSLSDGIRPHVIRQAIQAAGLKALGVYRDTPLSEEAIAELEDIRANKIPKMIVTDPSPVYNTEWKEAIEAYNMLDLTEMSIRASLMREETRGMYLRGEFPQKDDQNWACTLVARNKNGQMEFEKKEWPPVPAE